MSCAQCASARRACSSSCSDSSSSSSSSGDSTSSGSSSDSSCGGCCARPYAADNQDGKFDTCSKFAKQFKKFIQGKEDADQPTTKVPAFDDAAMTNIRYVGGENVLLTRFDVKALRKKQICAEVLIAHPTEKDVFLRMKLRNKADVAAFLKPDTPSDYIILNERAFETWRQYKKWKKKARDVYGRAQIVVKDEELERI